jgi:hypothetical protein
MPSRDSTHARRFVDNADADPQAYRAYVRQQLGVEPETAEALLGAHSHLHHGGRLEERHVKLLQGAYPRVASQIPALADELNAQAPGLRPRYFLAMLSGDTNVLHDRMHEAGDTYKALDKLSTTYHEEAFAHELNRRADGGKLKPEPAMRPVDPMSTRSIIERQLEPPGMRAMAEAVERGDPYATQQVRRYLADKADAATDTLMPEAEATTRDSVAAALDWHSIDAVATDEGWLPERDVDNRN